jgi:hypothetical protein
VLATEVAPSGMPLEKSVLEGREVGVDLVRAVTPSRARASDWAISMTLWNPRTNSSGDYWWCAMVTHSPSLSQGRTCSIQERIVHGVDHAVTYLGTEQTDLEVRKIVSLACEN